MPSCAALSEKGTISSDWLKKALLAPAKLSGPENLGSTASSETFLTILLWLPNFILVELQVVTPLKLFTGHDLIPTLAHVKPLLVLRFRSTTDCPVLTLGGSSPTLQTRQRVPGSSFGTPTSTTLERTSTTPLFGVKSHLKKCSGFLYLSRSGKNYWQIQLRYSRGQNANGSSC